MAKWPGVCAVLSAFYSSDCDWRELLVIVVKWITEFAKFILSIGVDMLLE